MAKYYGMICGNRSAATRTGTSNSGIRGSVQSWDGSVQTSMWHNQNNELVVSISVSEGSSSYGDRIFTGSIEELRKKLEK